MFKDLLNMCGSNATIEFNTPLMSICITGKVRKGLNNTDMFYITTEDNKGTIVFRAENVAGVAVKETDSEISRTIFLKGSWEPNGKEILHSS